MIRRSCVRCDGATEIAALRSYPRTASSRRYAIDAGPRASRRTSFSTPRATSDVASIGTESGTAAIARRGLILSIVATSGIVASTPKANAQAEPYTCDLKDSPIGIRYCDQVEGNGPEAKKQTRILAHYTGRLASDMTVFDSSYPRQRPLLFTIGTREVILGWDLGILGTEGIPPMKAGGKRRLILPPDYAYGSQGAGNGRIPPNATLIFDVEYLGQR